jgi:hypothetical protein
MKNPSIAATFNSWIYKSITILAVALYSVAGFCQAPGTVIGWGENSEGQTTIPSQATNIVAIAIGDVSCLALSANGTVTGWGANPYGQVDVLTD